MPRTAAQIAYTDHLAADIGYLAPPLEFEPTDNIHEDPAWTTLVDWFDAHIAKSHGWHDAVLVYISRRYDTPIQSVYANTDDWAKSQFRRLDVRDDPDAAHSYGN